MRAFSSACVLFATCFRNSARQLLDHLDGRDLALLSVATYKISRVIAKDRVTSAICAPFTTYQNDAGPGEVDEAARGTSPRRTIGELLICPYCLAIWVAAALTAGPLSAPRTTRAIASVLTAARRDATGSDADPPTGLPADRDGTHTP